MPIIVQNVLKKLTIGVRKIILYVSHLKNEGKNITEEQNFNQFIGKKWSEVESEVDKIPHSKIRILYPDTITTMDFCHYSVKY
jgi:hypothetical protein